MKSPFVVRTPRPGGIRAAIGLLVLIPILVPLVAAMLILLSERDAARAAEDKVSAAARIAAANVRLLIESTEERLNRMDVALGPDPAKFMPGPPVQGMTFAGLYDASGLTIARGGVRGQSVADNAEFRLLAGGKRWQITAMLGTAETLRFFGLGKRLERDGKFAGVTTAFLPADQLSTLWGSLALGPDSTVGLFRDDGMMVTRYPVPDKALDLKDYELFTVHLPRAERGVYHAPASPVDGHPRLVGYESLKDLGLVVAASMSSASASEGLWSRVTSTSLVAGPVFLIMVLLCGWAILLLLRHERSRAELQVALDRNRVLFQEIHHRVKNNLQAVASMVQLQQAPAAMKEDLNRRIAAMSAVHQHIYESDQFGVLDAEGYLAKLLEGLKASAPPGVELDWRLAPLKVSPDQALPLGLIVNEAVSNAFKHGFPDGKAGKVEVTLERPPAGKEAVLTIIDNGVGMSETPSGGRGMGTRLIAALSAQLEGKSTTTRGVSASDGGVRFVLIFPAEANGPA